MISFENPCNIEVFESFIKRFKKILNEKINSDKIIIYFINNQHPRFDWVLFENEPFATNPALKQSFIAINEHICENLKLTQEEQQAMIAHEIGHILDKNEKETDSQLLREYKADKLAVKLGLAKELKTGLEKLIKSENYSKEVKEMKKRLVALTQNA